MIDFAMLVQQCSPQVELPIAHSIVTQESRYNPLAIGVNAKERIKQPKTMNEAIATAKNLIARGFNIDLGLAQINSANLRKLGLSVEQVFEPCTNLKAMQTIYTSCLKSSNSRSIGTPMQQALSCYNTGNNKRGFLNGYVNSVTQHYNKFLGGGYKLNTKKIAVSYVSYVKEGDSIIAKGYNNTNVVNGTIDKSFNDESLDISQQSNETPIAVKAHANWDILKDF